MFGTNEIIGKKYFKDAQENTLMVTSMFFTLQGEGPYAGMPALFIRLANATWIAVSVTHSLMTVTHLPMQN
jgi:hypothetical protein